MSHPSVLRESLLHHFHSYHQFDISSPNLKLINLTDADKTFLNHLSIFKTAKTVHRAFGPVNDPAAVADRKVFLKHLQQYNFTQRIDARLFVVNATAEDLAYLESLGGDIGGNEVAVKGTRGGELVWATSGTEKVSGFLMGMEER
jgi:hypothetical protein